MKIAIGNLSKSQSVIKVINRQDMPNLDPGEWLIKEKEGQQTLYFCVKEGWTDKQISDAFRLLAQKAAKHLGKEAFLEFGSFQGFALPAMRGLFLSNYSLKSEIKESSLTITIPKIEGGETLIEAAKDQAEVLKWVMHLVDLPPNKKTPEIIGLKAKESAKEHGFDCEVWNDDHIVAGNLHALHAVGRGSVNEPVFIISRYFGRSENKDIDLALVGKGISFDTGGISIKPSTNLHYMKSDMAGAAAMLGTIELAARQKLKLNIAVVVPAAENAVDGKSLLPGEVIESHSGKTIEVIDTDAEGRLVLADGLSWACSNLNPKIIVDMATLTGSSVRALGTQAAALYSDNSQLVNAFYEAGLKTGEKVWNMPLWDDYNDYIHSDVADLSNLPLKPVAGSIAAAKFLQAFTHHHKSWVHIDMPGMSFGDSPFQKTKSATGYGVLLLAEFMHELASTANTTR